MASASSGYKLSLGADGPPGSYQDFDHADVFFVIGANMADCHPILFLRMMDRVKAGAKLIVVDPRRTATADKADLFLQIAPGTDLALLNGLLHLIVENGHTDAEFIAEFTEGWEVMPSFLEQFTPGQGQRNHRHPGRRHPHGGALDRRSRELDELLDHGTQPEHPRHLEHQRDLQPASGHRRDLQTGQRAVLAHRAAQRDGRPRNGLHGTRVCPVSARSSSTDDREFVEDQWGIPRGSLRTDVGNGMIDMFSRMADGQIKACWIICTNPVATVANRKTVLAGLERAELVITQDAFLETETNDYADVLLPAALWTESDGVMVNSERNLTLFQQAVEPPGQAHAGLADHRPDRLRDGLFGVVHLRLRRGGVRRDQAVLEPRDRL